MIDVVVPKDLYLIPSVEDEKFLLYRPSKQLVALITPEDASFIFSVLGTISYGHLRTNNVESQSLSLLKKEGFLDDSCDVESSACNDRRAHDFKCLDRDGQHFSPHEVTLDITQKCNMRCIYCYARGGDGATSMSAECGRAAIEWCISNAASKGSHFGLHFHGGGEPSQEFALLAFYYQFAQDKCKAEGIQLKSSAITNGLIAPEVLDFYCRHIDDMTLSLDGDQMSHDQQRLSARGTGTFEYVFKAGKALLSRNKNFNIRMTVTSKSVERLEEIVKFLIYEFPKRPIAVEPVTLVGRALGKEDLCCDPNQFANHVFSAMKVGLSLGGTVFYSGVSGHSQRKEFCAASGPSFCVRPDGSVTSCFSYSDRDVIKDMFIYGHYDKVNKGFCFDNKKIERLQSLNMEHDTYCLGCFCKSHCIGDCPAIRNFELTSTSEFVEKFDVDFMYNRRCATNRLIVALLLNDVVRGRISPPDYKHN